MIFMNIPLQVYVFFMNHKRSIITILFFILFLKTEAQERPRYIFVNTWTKWSAGKPSGFNRKVIDEITAKINAPENKNLRLGISYVFDYLRYDLDSVEKSLNNFLRLSRETNVPILINLDGLNWLESRPDLWNWWDPNKPGYNPGNRKNMEWTGWDDYTAVKISWRNWGSQLRILPAPNIMSPAVISAQISALNRLIPHIVKWYRSLPAGKKFLLGGVKLGHETSIGVNAYYYKEGNRYLERMPNDNSLDPLESFNARAGYNGGLTQLGYAAVKTAGIKHSGRITQDDIQQVVHRYLDILCQKANTLGLPQNLIFTHQGGTYSPWSKHLSFAPAANKYSLPGWSFYSVDPYSAGDLGDVLDKQNVSGWAAVEWWWPGENKLEWMYHLQRTLTFRDCRFLNIYNWDNSLGKKEDAIEAVREVIQQWEEIK